MNKILMVGAVMVQVILLTACTTMNSSFDCPNKSGVNCKSLDQINSMVDAGQIRGVSQMSDRGRVGTPKIASSSEFQSFPTSAFMPGQPIRYAETVQRIWIAPYEDTEGNYHQDTLIYSVMKGGHWIGNPVKTIQSL